MSEEQALIPIEQREIEFYEDEITAVLVEEEDGGRRVYVPIRPICDYMGVDWSGQRQRINRDPILSDIAQNISVGVTPSDIDPSSRRPHTSQMLALPLDFLNGFLFGINANRVKEEIRDRLLRYQRDCYRVLADAFLGPRETAVTPAQANLIQIRELARAVMEQADELIRIEDRQTAVEGRMEQAAQWAGQVNKRLSTVERRVKAGPLTEEQAAEVKKRVNQIAKELTKRDPDKVHYPSIYTALQHEAGVTSYKAIPPAAYEAIVNWLDEWLKAIHEAEEEE
jgi:hypothetical protein